MLCMRSLTSGDYRLTGNTVREIRDAIDRVATQLGANRRFQGRRLKSGPLLNVLALHFLLLSQDERKRIVERTLPELEKLLDAEEDVAAFMDRVDPRQPTWDPARDATPKARRNKKSG